MRVYFILGLLLSVGVPSCYSGPVTGERTPIARLSGPTQGMTGTPIRFDASESSDPDGPIRFYMFRIGDAGPLLVQSAPLLYYTFDTAGSYAVTVTVVDLDGLAASASISILVGQGPADVVTPHDGDDPDSQETDTPDLPLPDVTPDGDQPDLTQPDVTVDMAPACAVTIVGEYDWLFGCPDSQTSGITTFSANPAGSCTFKDTTGLLVISVSGKTITAESPLFANQPFSSCSGTGESQAFKIPCGNTLCVLRLEKRP